MKERVERKRERERKRILLSKRKPVDTPCARGGKGVEEVAESDHSNRARMSLVGCGESKGSPTFGGLRRRGNQRRTIRQV